MNTIDTPGTIPGVTISSVVTHGTFNLDGGTWEVDNNVYIIGDEKTVIVIDAAHDADPILEAIDGRRVEAILLTHGHDDHHSAVTALADATLAPIYLHPEDNFLYEEIQPRPADKSLTAGQTIDLPLAAGGVLELRVLHTPGHSPGSVCLHIPQLAAVFSGDTLFNGGPGATGRSFSDFDTILESITGSLLTLPSETLVLTGHGETTTIGDEAPHLPEWRARGH
ncbi:MBL fold metallo-hydrolase [Dermatophilus congolensis]|uniref:Hydroxyacylglutathione hydrolase n=1 Tax=Dermatophilus congolensis TaxID=1863 RepID=A0A239VDK7_9MICO|nr:MBL fold metallo-hydrolase [Dermatophilus congolensis]SNV20016.1 hydroxyacylglutathione hydrolase [Dermatophilus congolensis]